MAMGGGYGGPPPGGNWGPPPGGPPPAQPPGGYPPGGGGWGAPAPPPGAPPGYSDYQGFGGPPPAPGGVGRLLKHGLLGGLIGGALASIPLFNMLNACCCLLTNIGAVAGVGLYLRANPYDRMSDGDGAFCGMIAGATGGLVASLMGLMVNIALGSALAGIYGSLPPMFASRFALQSLATGLMMAPAYLILGGALGALSGFIGLSLFFKDRRR